MLRAIRIVQGNQHNMVRVMKQRLGSSSFVMMQGTGGRFMSSKGKSKEELEEEAAKALADKESEDGKKAMDEADKENEAEKARETLKDLAGLKTIPKSSKGDKLEKESKSEKDLNEELAKLTKPSRKARLIKKPVDTALSFNSTLSSIDVPHLLAIPLTRRPLFPGFYKSLYIKDPLIIQAIRSLVASGIPYIGIFLAKSESCEKDLVDEEGMVENVGVLAQITNVYQTEGEGVLTVVVYPHRRIKVVNSGVQEYLKLNAEEDKTESVEEAANGEKVMLDELKRLKVPITEVIQLEEEKFEVDNKVIKATTSEIVTVLKEISQGNPLLRDQIITVSVQTGNLIQEPNKLADFAAAISAGEPKELQAILESLNVEERLHKSLVVLKKELANAKLQQEISQEVDKKISRKNQEYFLMEQLKGIKKELGLESDGKEKMIQSFREKVLNLNMPDHARKVFDEEIQKLTSLEPQASEFNVTRNYLDWITTIPWGKRSTENFEIKIAKEVLDEDHYGLKDVKERILEFIAVGKLRGSVEGKIITLVGPPGVGKTSVGKSIARALGREFYRFSVGGLTDVAEIKGHRRTYVGAMPGKVIQALKKVKTENPLIMIDEIDKLGRGHQGDPASALLELLDPEQNSSFLDHYMDMPVDLSQVLFVCTANTLDTIPGPLLDRMELITLSGYVAEEKVKIADKYLGPQSIEACGLTDYSVDLKQDAILALIRNYCRENGVRNLKKHIDKIYRKTAFRIVNEDIAKDHKIEISADNLREFVGPPVFTSDRMYESTPPGVIMGLAWTQMGGSTLYIESVLESALKKDSKPSFHRTGQMGDVMKESSTIAYTYAKSFMARKFPENTFFDKASVHMHIPEGATPKDGPSGGCTMTTSLLSLALAKSVIPDVAMTGEITVTGKILKIGGLKEKAIAAKRSGVKTIIFPASNKSDWDELPEFLKEGLDPHFAAWYEDIYDIVFKL